MEDLRGYFKRKKLVGRVYQTRLAKEQMEPAVAPVSDFDSRLVLAELAAAVGKRAEAKQALDALEKNVPVCRKWRVTSVRWLCSRRMRRRRASTMKLAFERGETDARMCFTLAMMERAVGQKPDLTVAALERALKSRPGYTAAAIQLGEVEIARRDFPAAIAALMAIPKVMPEQAAEVFCGLSYAFLEHGELEARPQPIWRLAGNGRSPSRSSIASLR